MATYTLTVSPNLARNLAYYGRTVETAVHANYVPVLKRLQLNGTATTTDTHMIGEFIQSGYILRPAGWIPSLIGPLRD